MADSLLKLKLDMVYRDLPVEEAQKRYAELAGPPPAEVPPPPPKPKRKIIKALVPSK